MSETTFPLDNFREAASHLRRPFSPAAVKFRPISGNRCASYIDARLVVERLNLVVPHLWSHRFEPVQGGMRCDLTVDGLTRSDVGWSKGVNNDMDLKALYSDAIKRAGVHFGIGVSLYAVPALWANADAGHLKQNGTLSPRGEGYLRGVYRLWLEQHGESVYGIALDHGDLDVPERSDEPEEYVDDVTADRIEKACRELVKAGTWDTKTLTVTLKANGARDTSSVGKAIRSLTPDEAKGLERVLNNVFHAMEPADPADGDGGFPEIADEPQQTFEDAA